LKWDSKFSFQVLTVVITGCDESEQFGRNLFEHRPCITSPVDYLVGQFIYRHILVVWLHQFQRPTKKSVVACLLRH
jgi:hypothetical protein